MKSDYYEFRYHEDELQSSIKTKMEFQGLTSLFRVVTYCLHHCCARVAQEIWAIQTYRCLRLPHPYECSPYSVLAPLNRCVATIGIGLARCTT